MNSPAEQANADGNRAEMGELIRSFDWSHTPVGPRDRWPSSLQTTVNLMLGSQFPMALLWGPELILIYNDAYREIAADKHPSALGRPTREIWSEVWHINQPIFAAVMEQGETLHFEDKLFPINRRGRLEDAYFTLCYSPVRVENDTIGGTLVVLQETTLARERLRQLQASEEKYRSLFENMAAQVHLWKLIRDPQGAIQTWRLVDINPAGLRNWGKKRAEITGKTADEIFPGATAQFMPIVQKIFADGAPLSWESYFPGTNEYLQMTSVPFGEYFISTGVDITARKQAELALQQRTAELTAANKELEAFAYSVSHDLRAPLRATEGFSRIVQEKYGDKLNTIGREYLQEVRNASVQMGHLIDDLLGLSRITRMEMTRQPVNLSDLARNVVTHLHQHDPNRQVEVAIADGLVTEGDPRLLRVVLDNLLGNAWKFTGKTGHPRIEFGQAEQNTHPVFFVRDNGAGFDMAYTRKIFHAFQRLHSVSEFEGTGIGLATVQRVIHRHGGRVWAEGAVNQGATFYFTLWERTHHEPPNHSAR